ncbi:hypothetical protein M0R45_009105 [Rubus argutus]|uniref:Uncharacterized protein n=1 Tax=Rubus argutus TaxID=59490 RepID=A0AAW1Y5K8_RUBAR
MIDDAWGGVERQSTVSTAERGCVAGFGSRRRVDGWIKEEMGSVMVSGGRWLWAVKDRSEGRGMGMNACRSSRLSWACEEARQKHGWAFVMIGEAVNW